MQLGARLLVDRQELTADGIEHVPASGPVVLAVRHYHHRMDGLGLLAQIGRPLHIMIALDWISDQAIRRRMEWLARCCAWPVTLRNMADRHDADAPPPDRPSAYREAEIQPYQNRAYRQCVELIGAGRAVAIFPEGFPVIDPHAPRKPRSELLAPFKSGFARVAVSAARRHGGAVPVVPVGIRPDAQDTRRLAFAYGAPEQVTQTTDVDALIARTRHHIARLSS